MVYRGVEQESAFANRMVSGWLPGKQLNAELLYDSFAQQVAVGTRSNAMSVRQMLYRAGPYQIDVQVEAQPDRNRLLVTGQLVDASHPDLLDADTQVTLSDGRGNIVNTFTNQFGEFRAEVILSGDLEISLLSRDGKPIVILLRGTQDSTSRGKN